MLISDVCPLDAIPSMLLREEGLDGKFPRGSRHRDASFDDPLHASCMRETQEQGCRYAPLLPEEVACLGIGDVTFFT